MVAVLAKMNHENLWGWNKKATSRVVGCIDPITSFKITYD